MGYELEIENDERRGNPSARMRYQWQTYSLDGETPYESEWAQTKEEAIRQSAKHLIWAFNKWGKDDMIIKIFNNMNHKKEPIVLTLADARKVI
jgi:hypothetical protein